MAKRYTNELDGQEGFYNQFLSLIVRSLTIEEVQHDNLDGQIGNVLVEMKLRINDLNKVAFQAVKYLSRLRIKGYPVPKRFALIDLNGQKAHIFESEDYRAEIEVPYFSSASVEKQGFILRSDAQVIEYSKQVGTYDLVGIFRTALKEVAEDYESAWFPVHVDVTNIVGLAEQYYRLNKNATKSSFLGDGSRGVGEIRLPNSLKGQIIPYEGETNEVFGYLMDKLNDNFQKKDLGAFFTPPEYARLAHELVFDAIRKHQESGNRDYIILDRCAGTGNLELELNDNVPDDIIDKDILSHVIVNTYEYYEYRVLMERLGDKVRLIIPPTEDETTFMDGLVRGSNALSEEFIENEVIQQYVKDDSVTVIVFENPPFVETTSVNHQKAKRGKSSSSWKQDRGTLEAKQDLKGARSNDMANVFIWTAMNYYLRQPHDSLIVFSPLKYWKNGDWMNLTFERGFAMNRRHFHTTQDTVVSCIHWLNVPSDSKHVELEAVEIDGNDRGTVKANESILSTVSGITMTGHSLVTWLGLHLKQKRKQSGPQNLA